MSNFVDVKPFTGGAVETMQLSGGPQCRQVQIGFDLRSTGSITVKARGVGAQSFDPVTNGVVNLATNNTLTIPGAIAELQFTDGGTGAYKVTVISFT
ncbi:MAG: hypothetical protein E6R03_16350 [Hyphomicrobiaceae bacterium]|nr:MAG: hypothetical protein E6R03_16350 [Hyphomicrobiaceae bacterium]